jgi:hypothetical protein
MLRHEGDSEFNLKTQGRTRDLERRVISLATALDNFELNVAGNVIYCDKLSTGSADIRFSSTSNDPLPVGANFGLEQMDFKRLYITCAAQAGKYLNLWFGSDVHIIPPNQDINNIGTVSLISAITPRSLGTSTYYRSSASAALNTILAPASNVNGVVIVSAALHGAADAIRMMAKSSAPSSFSDTSAMEIATRMSTAVGGFVSMPLLVQAGLGLYEQANGTGGVTGVNMGYTIL